MGTMAATQRVREKLTPKRFYAPSLDALNFLISDVTGALGPSVFLVTDRHWALSNAGLVAGHIDTLFRRLPTQERYALRFNATGAQTLRRYRGSEISRDENALIRRRIRDARRERPGPKHQGDRAGTPTTTTTNPGASVGVSAPSDGRSHATEPSGTDRPNTKATKSAERQYEKEGKSGASLK